VSELVSVFGKKDMDTIEECGGGGRHLGLGSRILVGVPDNCRGFSELLSWAIGAVAKANDSVVAVHVLGECVSLICIMRDCKLHCCCSPCIGCSWLRSIACVILAGRKGRKKRLQKANAFLIYMFGQFVEACEAKQVKFHHN
jgi:hypothetical protein